MWSASSCGWLNLKGTLPQKGKKTGSKTPLDPREENWAAQADPAEGGTLFRSFWWVECKPSQRHPQRTTPHGVKKEPSIKDVLVDESLTLAACFVHNRKTSSTADCDKNKLSRSHDDTTAMARTMAEPSLYLP